MYYAYQKSRHHKYGQVLKISMVVSSNSFLHYRNWLLLKFYWQKYFLLLWSNKSYHLSNQFFDFESHNNSLILKSNIHLIKDLLLLFDLIKATKEPPNDLVKYLPHFLHNKELLFWISKYNCLFIPKKLNDDHW